MIDGLLKFSLTLQANKTNLDVMEQIVDSNPNIILGKRIAILRNLKGMSQSIY